MRAWRSAGLLAIILAMSGSALAQWPSVLTPGVPKTADGKPDLNAPAPRTPDGKPDLSAIWTNNRGQRGAAGAGQRGANAGQRGANGDSAAPATPAAPAAATTNSGPPMASFANVGSGFPEGLPFQPWAADLVKKRKADYSKDNPDAH